MSSTHESRESISSEDSFKFDSANGSFHFALEKEPAQAAESFRETIRHVKDAELLNPRYDNSRKVDVPVFQSHNLLYNLPNQVERRTRRNPTQFTLMVAGRSGLGKTTFVNMLLQSSRKQMFEQSSKSSRSQYALKTTQIEIRQAQFEENGVVCQFSLIDTPGFADYINNNNCWVPIVNYIDKQHMSYMFQEEQPDRSRLTDTRVNVCLYFIEPSGHQLSKVDIHTMKEIAIRVNLVPVIAKADMLTRPVLEKFKHTIRKQLNANHINIFRPDDLPDHMVPFALVCSDKTVSDGERNFLGRRYRYGVVDIENPVHSDFAALRDLVVRKHMLDLKEMTHEVHYQQQRLISMLYRRKCATLAAKGNTSGIKRQTLSFDLDEYNASEKVSSIEFLKSINKFGNEFMQQAHVDQDVMFLEKVKEVKARFNRVASFQSERFTKMQSNLRSIKQDGERELKQIVFDVNQLTDEIGLLKQRMGIKL